MSHQTMFQKHQRQVQLTDNLTGATQSLAFVEQDSPGVQYQIR